uniref:Uncharacterized protein n=1 Tax=Sphaerodactylus townsendi TaxID=933632 RepID=A0ACB8ES17_9SAUR
MTQEAVHHAFIIIIYGKCVNDCGVGFYSDEITAECEPCHRTCATCEGFNYNDCTSCKGTLELFHGKCVKPRSKQTDGKFWNERQKLHISNGFGSANLKYRLLLYVHSQSLQSTENDLLIVPSVYRVQAKRAVREVFSVAAPQLWKPLPLKVHQTQSLNTVRKRSTSTQFQSCDPSCKTCEKTAGTCTSCSLGKFLFDGFCIHTCPQGTFGNMKMRKCENCTENCEKCIRTNHCLKCQSDLDEPHYLYQGKCLLECPECYKMTCGNPAVTTAVNLAKSHNLIKNNLNFSAAVQAFNEMELQSASKSKLKFETHFEDSVEHKLFGEWSYARV